MGQTASLDAVVKRTVPVPSGNRMPVLSLAASSFTDIKFVFVSTFLGETEC